VVVVVGKLSVVVVARAVELPWSGGGLVVRRVRALMVEWWSSGSGGSVGAGELVLEDKSLAVAVEWGVVVEWRSSGGGGGGGGGVAVAVAVAVVVARAVAREI
jgi:hypothetical protein